MSSNARTILLTGGAGFIGSHLLRLLVNKYPDYSIVNLDALTYAGNLENLAALKDDARHVFRRGDIGDAALVESLFREFRPRLRRGLALFPENRAVQLCMVMQEMSARFRVLQTASA